MTQKNFEVFHRTWWRLNEDWPDGREPGAGRAYHVGWAATESEAREMCRAWNDAHRPGLLSDRAEYSYGRFT